MRASHLPQVGAVPVRGAPGAREVLLITSRESGRWIIPKGWPMKGRKDHDAAAREAFEEAGVTGQIHKRPTGAYTYDKRSETNLRPIRVMVYLLQVEDEKESWPEQQERLRRWMSPESASALVEEAGLAAILRQLDVHYE